MSALKAKGRKIFEIPICTICLEPMIKDLCVFTVCGHVFHYNCGVNCHQNSRKCPNCRMRSTEIQSLHYAVEEITGIDEQMSKLLNDLSVDQKQHMSKLLSDHEELLHENRRIMQRNKFVEEKNESIQTEVQHIQAELMRSLEKSKELEIKEKSQCSQLKTLEVCLQSLEEDNKRLKQEVENNEIQLKGYHYLETLSKVINNPNEDTQKSPSEQAKQIYDLYVIKVGQFKTVQKEVTQLQEQREQQQKKYEQLQQKYERMKDLYEELQKENMSIKELSRTQNQNPVQKIIEHYEDQKQETELKEETCEHVKIRNNH
ncbi:unnamed protein product (macronuclear) [Paramecium tetraurelia]|uniref:RING-type domain-containing protein n=1 Tax=Paramecium tetraurelia TaxID=5888 RepID=A0C648_PARTE|nr:uncharacterized protein GSPATT00035394001 [Paramecium tetraurelia]CAK66265.1 unnamed protein product [Paramecium tetraurelia]|eukprot:XP_001433662.1 hypothetical protein (macronuclear) [Paramecium tetraurelia strain d4-2]